MVTTIVFRSFCGACGHQDHVAISATSVPYQDTYYLDGNCDLRWFAHHGRNRSILRSDSHILRKQLRFRCCTTDISRRNRVGENRQRSNRQPQLQGCISSEQYLCEQFVEHCHLLGDWNLSLDDIVDLDRLHRQLHPHGNGRGLGSLTTGPTGTISFLDTSNGNNVLGTENLVVSTLATTFVQNQPFAIGGPGDTQRSVAIASAYLNADNNLDVVTGDARARPSLVLLLAMATAPSSQR